jgi:hypothetical protein
MEYESVTQKVVLAIESIVQNVKNINMNSLILLFPV